MFLFFSPRGKKRVFKLRTSIHWMFLGLGEYFKSSLCLAAVTEQSREAQGKSGNVWRREGCPAEHARSDRFCAESSAADGAPCHPLNGRVTPKNTKRIRCALPSAACTCDKSSAPVCSAILVLVFLHILLVCTFLWFDRH